MLNSTESAADWSDWSDGRPDVPSVTAFQCIERIMRENTANGKHTEDEWRGEPEDEHVMKAVRHLQTYLIQKYGHEKADGEDHRRNALARVAMALTLFPEPSRPQP